ncbi:P-loop NTPase [Streptosporangium pseudovulgare]|uniref:Novel STAND NTPase 5 domain-containing protein n=1 Tax=Streptosporangium pseudovulgare TaxID=35765 RepID=A0ABQ2R5H3_9ACTN|nr:ATP-binding protein [Streptosporangium pseudovulgare]GGQ08998.1 hypothetical protein GCM10010140_43940 [Streptosporangium pseudovulgare]
MEPQAVVELQYKNGRGSGYAIAPRLVLSAAHAVPGLRQGVRVQTESGAYQGLVIWRGADPVDAALVEIVDPAWPAAFPSPVRWGRIITVRQEIPCTAWGFPAFMQPDGNREVSQAPGTLNPGDGRLSDRYVFNVAPHPPGPVKNEKSPWSGMSGASLFCGDLLTGILILDKRYTRNARLEALPAYALHADPGFREVAARFDVRTGELEAVELSHLSDPMIPAARSPSWLLRADQEIVRFRGREDLLRDLVDWVDGSGFAARLLHGPGGQGKTRLAKELAGRLQRDRWTVAWVSADIDAAELDVVADVREPLLLIVDYAESRLEHLRALLRACARRSQARSPLRLLLLARSAGDWWKQTQRVTSHTEALLQGAPVTELAPVDADAAGRHEAYEEALQDFAAALAMLPGYDDIDWYGLAANLVQPGDVERSMLGIHMTALADLLDAAFGRPLQDADVPEDRILNHEARYWDATARGLESRLRRQALVATFLAGVHDEDEAERLLRHADNQEQVREWLSSLYPVRHAPWGALQPDRLVERFLGLELLESTRIADLFVELATDRQLHQMMDTFARAATHPSFGTALHAVLAAFVARHKDQLARFAVQVATWTRAPEPLVATLWQVAETSDTAFLAQLERATPQQTQILADWALDVATKAVRPTDPLSLSRLAFRQVWVGNYDQARETSRRAVRRLSWLAGWDRMWKQPGAARSHAIALSDTLILQARCTYRTGNSAGAVSLCLRALRVHRALMRRVGEQDYLLSLAGCLVDLVDYLKALNRLFLADLAIEALVVVNERRTLLDPSSRSAAASALLAMGHNGRDAHPDRVLEASARSVVLFQALMEEAPDAYLPDFVKALSNHVLNLLANGHHQEAAATFAETSDVVGKLDHHSSHRSVLAEALALHGYCLYKVGDQRQALDLAARVVDMYRSLAGERDTWLAPMLADALVQHAFQLELAEQQEQAQKLLDEAIGTFRALARLSLVEYGPSLVRTLVSTTILAAAAGLAAKAVETAEEATHTFGRLARRKAPTLPLGSHLQLMEAVDVLRELGHEHEAEKVAACREKLFWFEYGRGGRRAAPAWRAGWQHGVKRGRINLLIFIMAHESVLRDHPADPDHLPHAFLKDFKRRRRNAQIEFKAYELSRSISHFFGDFTPFP